MRELAYDSPCRKANLAVRGDGNWFEKNGQIAIPASNHCGTANERCGRWRASGLRLVDRGRLTGAHSAETPQPSLKAQGWKVYELEPVPARDPTRPQDPRSTRLGSVDRGGPKDETGVGAFPSRHRLRNHDLNMADSFTSQLSVHNELKSSPAAFDSCVRRYMQPGVAAAPH